jgi:hypothetical protein
MMDKVAADFDQINSRDDPRLAREAVAANR